MKLATFRGGFGRIEGDTIVPMGEELIAYLRDGSSQDGDPLALDEVELLAPVPRPGKILAVGPSYLDHAREAEQEVPGSPDDLIVMAMFANSIVGPSQDVEMPAITTQVDYEAELAVVIGATTREVSVEEAPDCIAGYLCVNDITDRNLQFRLGGLRGLIRSKAIDTFLPTGPWIVTPDELPDVGALTISCRVNGETVQRASTADMLFSVAEIISSLSKTITLEPGDLVSTGSPPGVGYGRQPQLFLQDGDVVTVEIEGIGELTNRIRRREAPKGT